ncbi:DUF4333 domain-containing protein [Nocardia australiensis]|uniref:DUF4333 domain-containing protein n=1 Tax=Nocardia australiensis TaxID=2887191 RepID=UPI001D1383D6|nr:DUF4333 domain-containing protein [Nocardia australiensis]
MSGPYGPNDAPGPGEGRNDPTQQWGGQQAPGGAGPTQQWGGQQQPAAQPTQHWNQQPGQPQQHPWGQQQPNQPVPPQPQPGQPQPAQQHWGQQPGQQQPGQPQWGQTPSQPQQQWGQQPGQPQDWNQQGQQPQQQDWGQQGQQPQGQWGQPQWGQGQQAPQAGAAKSKKGLFIGLGVVAVVAIGAIVALVLALTSKDELDNSAVQDGVKKVLSDSYGIQDVADVSCPSGQKVAVDATFTCSLKVSGEQKNVTVKITKDDGTYEVGRPS